MSHKTSACADFDSRRWAFASSTEIAREKSAVKVSLAHSA
jgi:hypothetical protein